MDYMERINLAAKAIEEKIGTAEIAIILGSGLGDFGNTLSDAKSIPYSEIPGFPSVSVQGHAGVLSTGIKGGKRILDLLGRNLDTFVDIVINPGETLAGLAEPMRGVLVERFSEMTASLPSMAQASTIQKAAMKPVFKAAFTVMMEVASLPEADRAHQDDPLFCPY